MFSLGSPLLLFFGVLLSSWKFVGDLGVWQSLIGNWLFLKTLVVQFPHILILVVDIIFYFLQLYTYTSNFIILKWNFIFMPVLFYWLSMLATSAVASLPKLPPGIDNNWFLLHFNLNWDIFFLDIVWSVGKNTVVLLCLHQHHYSCREKSLEQYLLMNMLVVSRSCLACP